MKQALTAAADNDLNLSQQERSNNWGLTCLDAKECALLISLLSFFHSSDLHFWASEGSLDLHN